MAGSLRAAENFVANDMKDSIRRLHYIDEPHCLYGRRDWVIYIHPTAERHPKYRELIGLARQQGCILLHVDETYARQRYYAEQQAKYKADEFEPITFSRIPWEQEKPK
jgi:hypothetical protein